MSEDFSNVTVNNEYKDRLLNFMFGSPENKKWTLSLYNAVNGSNYTDENAIEINTIKEVLYLGMHNDTSFLVSDMMNIYEHQSSYNPNMPLRQLQYLGSLYEGYVTKNKLNKFGSKLLELPVPKLVVFYNGLLEKEDESILKLSDSFIKEHRDEADVEVRVRMININYGHNKKLMEACRPLYEYSWLIKEIRQNCKNMEKENAVNKAVEDIPDNFVIKPFLRIHKSEVFTMLLTEYNEEEVMGLFKEDGKVEGRGLHLISQICKKLQRGKTIEVIASEVEENVEIVKAICDVADKYAPNYDTDAIYSELVEKKILK